MRATGRDLLRQILPLLLAACVPASSPLAGPQTECCSSIVPEFPPATAYGANITRTGNPRNGYVPYAPIPPDAIATEGELITRIEALQNTHGPYSSHLVPELSDLGAARFGKQEFAESMSAYDRAIHLLRINRGLATPLQIPLVELSIEAKLQQGELVAADRQHEYLYRLQREAQDVAAPEMLAAVQQYADWQRTAYLAELDKHRYARLVDMIDLFSNTSEAVAEAEGEYSPALLPYLEGKLTAQYLLSIYPGEKERGLRVEMHQRDDVDLPTLKRLRFLRFRDHNYRYGERNIKRMLSIVEHQSPADKQQEAELLVALGDWYQWHRRYALALRTYRDAWQRMKAEPGGDAWLGQTFGSPVELPADIVFQPGRIPLRLHNSARVIARFKVTRHGEAKSIQIEEPSSSDNQSAVTHGYKYLRDMRFRPRLEDGKAVEAVGIERSYDIRY